MRRRLLKFLCLFGLMAAALVGHGAKAGAATIYLAPSSATVYQSVPFVVQIRVNAAGQPVNAVQANLTYDPAKLDFIGISSAGSAFDVSAQSTGGGGSVKIARGAFNPVTSNVSLASVTFRPKLSSGSTTVTFAGGTAMVRSTDNANILSSNLGGTYTLAPTPAKISTPAGPVDNSPPKISDVKVVLVTPYSATITWTTDEPATTIVDYGLTSAYGLSAQTGNFVTSHNIALPSNVLLPALSYHFRVRSLDAAGNKAVSPDATFHTLGFIVNITVKNKGLKAIARAKITLADLTGHTDKNGLVKFSDVPLGDHIVNVSAGLNSQSFTINVQPTFANGQIEPQSFQLILQPLAANYLRSYWWTLLILIVIILAIRRDLKFHWHRHRGTAKVYSKSASSRA